MKVLVTGSSGLIGSEAVQYYDRLGHQVVGFDNDMRREFFGPEGSTKKNLKRLMEETDNFIQYTIDIRDTERVEKYVAGFHPNLIIHCAAQPSHDKAAEIPMVDFEVNALGTMNLLEATRRYCNDAVFIHMSTNKVYGDLPNDDAVHELDTRFDRVPVSERMSIDQSLHSLFGASKAAADLMAQEYGRYYGLKTGIFRGGCLTGPAHSGVELHGFLSYLVKCAKEGRTYKVFGYKGKQVRDQIHSVDVISAFDEFAKAPRPGEVYNIGGGPQNSISIVECFAKLEKRGFKVKSEYVEENRRGDHICYISDTRKLQEHFPSWKITRSIDDIIDELLVSA